MHITRPFLFAATATSIALVLSGLGTLSAKPDKPNPHKPVPATDTVLVEKITLRGKQPRAVGGGRKTTQAATGWLGEVCYGTRYAIVVGISNYPGRVNDLDYADDDAVLMTQVLDEVYGFTDITTLVGGYGDKYVTRADVMDAIGRVRRIAEPGDEVVFFFSGHGMSGIAADGDSEKVDEAIVVVAPRFDIDPIWDGELRDAFTGFATSRIIFIFDTCLAGGMDDLQEPGRVILMAADERSYAYEGDEWGQGEFTYYLAEGIVGGAANTHDYLGYGTGLPPQVTAEEAFDYAKVNCVEDKPVIVDAFPDDLWP